MVTLPENWSDWKIIGELGTGGYSVVYEAVRQDHPSVHCAIKVISIPRDDSELDELYADGFTQELSASYFQEAVKDFSREIGLMEHFKGMQNIVSIEDFKVVPRENRIGSEIFIRMELLTSLEKYISDKNLSEKEVLQIGADICTALEFCHEQGIIHRDIKPANIFANDRVGTHVFYKLGDFGIARNLSSRTQGLSSRGTPNYMAPEVALRQPYDTRADLYSLGLTLYWLMNGKRLPFYPQTQLYLPSVKEEAMYRRISGEPLDPPANASSAFAALILKACAFRPEDRYQSATEMKQALETLLAGTPAALAFGTVPGTAPGTAAGTDPDAAGSTVSSASSSTAADTAPGSPGEASVSGAPPCPAKKTHRGLIPACVAAALLLIAGAGYAFLRPHGDPPPQPPAVTAEQPAVPAETPDPMAEAIAANQITGVFAGLADRKEEISAWENRIREDRIILPAHWASIPFSGSLSDAPKVSASVSGSRLRIGFEDVPSHNRTVSMTLGLRKVTGEWNEEEAAFLSTLPEGNTAEGLILTVSYTEADTRILYLYEPAGTLSEMPAPLSCVSAQVILGWEQGTVSALSGAEGSDQYEVQACGRRIIAHYTGGDLTGYEDQTAGCSYDRDGLITSGELPKSYLSPVFLSESGGEEPESAQRTILKKMQAMQPGAREIYEYGLDGHIYMPECWSELPGSDISLEDAPLLSVRPEGSAAFLVFPEGEDKWAVDPDQSQGITREGDRYLADLSSGCTVCLTLDTLPGKQIGDQNIRCSLIYLLTGDGTLQPYSISYTFCTVERYTVATEGSESWPLSFPRIGMRAELGFNGRVEWLDFFSYTYILDGETESPVREYIASYLRGFHQEDGRLSEQVVRGLSLFGAAENFLIRPRAATGRSVPCVRVDEQTVLRIERRMDASADPAASPLSRLCGDPGGMEMIEDAEADSVCGSPGDWHVRKVMNRSEHTLCLADVASDAEQEDTARSFCVPGVIPPGEAAWIISEGEALPDLWFVRDDSMTVLAMETEMTESEIADPDPGYSEEEDPDPAVPEKRKALSAHNPCEEDAFFLDWLYFCSDENGALSVFLNERHRMLGSYMIPAGESILLVMEKEGGESAYVWGYPES